MGYNLYILRVGILVELVKVVEDNEIMAMEDTSYNPLGLIRIRNLWSREIPMLLPHCVVKLLYLTNTRS